MSDTLLCETCGEHKPWQRFRLRLGNGTTKEVSVCSTCRQRKASIESGTKARLKKQHANKIVLNRTQLQYQLDNKIAHYYPDVEKDMRTYCNTKTAMDRKYLRDNQDKPLNNVPSIAAKQTTAREHAKGWVAFYNEICEHAINLLRQTGKRPPFAQMEGSGTLQLVHGLYNTKRAAKLRERG